MIEYVSAFLISSIIGIIAAIIGLGGGFLFVPTLTLVFGLDPRMAIGTSLATMVFTAVSASFFYRKQGLILYKVAGVLMIPAIPASMAGSYITTLIDARIIVLIFCLMLMLISLEMLLPRFRFLKDVRFGPSFVLTACIPNQGCQPVNRVWYSHLIVWGAMGGLLSGVTGTSGGAVFVPALLTAGIPLHYAVATSMFAIIVVAITGASVSIAYNQIAWPLVAFFGAGSAAGAYIGTRIAPAITESRIRMIFGIFLLCIAAIMFQQKVLAGF